jgi:CheY-like chemotaxis protein
MRNAFRLMLVALVLWGPQLCPAAEPLSLAEAMNERSALGRALTNQFARPGGEASAEGSHTSLNLAAVLLVAAMLAALRFVPPLVWRVRPWIPKLAGPDDLSAKLLEEPSIVAFFESLKDGPATLATGLPVQARAPTSARAAAAAPDRLREFYDSTPRHLAELQTLFSEISRAPDEAARQAKLLESFQRASALRESAGLPEVRPVWQVAFALEELLKQLLRKASNVTPSVFRTIAGALDLLRDLCNRRSRPDLATEPPVRLLTVDDDSICLRAIAFALAKAFPKPDLAPDGEAALVLAPRHPYDAIFLDVEMPGMDGFELCSRIHETELNRTTPVVFVTRHDGLESRAQATLLGAQDFIAKPFLVFEITVKALTMVMRARLDHSAAEPAPAPRPEATSTAPAVPASATAAASVAVALPDQPGLSAGRDKTPPSGSFADDSGGGVAPPFPPPSSAAASVQAAALRGPSPGALPAPSQPASQERAHVFYTHAPAQTEVIRKHLASAGDATPDGLSQLLADLYLDVHRLCADAHRAELGAALRLASALEAMVKKLFDCPKLCTPSSLEAAAGALAVLDELCRARTDPDLAQPAVRLMVVDDDAVACRAIAVSLQLVFDRPDSAESGEAALALAGKRGYDLIFLDVRMPGMDGFATCSQIHATVLNRLTPVVFVTRASDTASRAHAAASGGCGFIPKPVLASQITLVALSYILLGRLGRQIPPLEAPPAPAGSGPEPALPQFAGAGQPPLASAAVSAS